METEGRTRDVFVVTRVEPREHELANAFITYDTRTVVYVFARLADAEQYVFEQQEVELISVFGCKKVAQWCEPAQGDHLHRMRIVARRFADWFDERYEVETVEMEEAE